MTGAATGHSPLPLRVYTPESALRQPGKLAREMFQDLWLSRELAWRLFIRDTSARYRQSILGYLWAFLPPIANTLTFVLLNRSGVLRGGDERIPYLLFVVVGTLLWQVFADAVMSPIKSAIAAKPMLAKINFPREAIILAGLLEVALNFAIRMVLLIPILIYFRTSAAAIPAAFFGSLAIVCLGMTVGLALTPVGLLYNDINNALTIGMTFWMFFTPVVYTPPATGTLAALMRANPVTPLIVATREWLTIGSATDPALTVWIFLGAAVVLFAGWTFYRLAMPILVERMGG